MGRIQYNEMSKFRKMFGQKPTRSIEPEYYKWKFYDNPSQKGFIHFEAIDDVIVSSASICPRKVIVMGKEYSGAELCDAFTLKDFRRQGMFSRCISSCTKYCLESGIETIYGTPIEMLIPVYKEKLNFPVCANAEVVSMTKHIGIRHIRESIARKTRIRSRFLTTPLAMIYQRLLYARPKAVAANSNIIIQEIKHFPDGIDGLWGTDRTDYAFFVKRDTAYLNWRYFENPDKYIVYLAKDGEGHALGYAAIKLIDDRGMISSHVCDFVATKDDKLIFMELLSYIDKKHSEWGVDSASVYCVSRTLYHTVLRRYGYKSQRNIPIIVFNQTESGKSIHNLRLKWYFTKSDADNI